MLIDFRRQCYKGPLIGCRSINIYIQIKIYKMHDHNNKMVLAMVEYVNDRIHMKRAHLQYVFQLDIFHLKYTLFMLII